MKAQENMMLYRTDGNTDPLLVVLRTETADGVYTLVPDDATVEMDVTVGTTTYEIIATAKGDDSGTFLFPTTSLPSANGKFSYDIDVTTVAGKATYARGKIVTAKKIEEA